MRGLKRTQGVSVPVAFNNSCNCDTALLMLSLFYFSVNVLIMEITIAFLSLYGFQEGTISERDSDTVR